MKLHVWPKRTVFSQRGEPRKTPVVSLIIKLKMFGSFIRVLPYARCDKGGSVYPTIE